jgi:hypothetical protein
MLSDFGAATSSMMLFLKSVEQIEIHHITASGAAGGGDGSAATVRQQLARTRVDVAAGGAQLRSLRAMRRCSTVPPAAAAAAAAAERPPLSAQGDGGGCGHCTYELCLRREGGAALTAAPPEGGLTVAVPGGCPETERWLIHWSAGCGGGVSGTAKQEGGMDDDMAAAVAGGGGGSALAEGLGLSTWVAVAVPLGVPARGAYRSAPVGRAYCFLPLPITTGLHTHVHAAFALSSNRRDLWSAQDVSGTGTLKAQWNHHLLHEALPRCVADAIHILPAVLQRGGGGGGDGGADDADTVFYSALPNLEQVLPPFETLAANAIRRAATTRDGSLLLFDESHPAQPWVPFSESIFQDEAFIALFADDNKVRQLLASGCGDHLGSRHRLVAPPAFVYKSFMKAGVPVVLTSPMVVAGALRRQKPKLSRTQAGKLLQYLLMGTRSTNKDVFRNLLGLKVAPLAAHSNGSKGGAMISAGLGTFQARTNCSHFLYICPKLRLDEGPEGRGTEVDGRQLMPTFPHFIDPEAPPEALAALSSAQALGQLNILRLNVRAVVEHMEFILPKLWRNKPNPVPLDEPQQPHSQSSHSQSNRQRRLRKGKLPHAAGQEVPSAAEMCHRLKLLWAFIEASGERVDITRGFAGWPLVIASRSEPSGSAEYYAMSVEVAQRCCVLSRERYSASELQVLDGFGVMFLFDAPERLCSVVQGPEKVSIALRAVAVQPAVPCPELCQLLRGLTLKWLGDVGRTMTSVSESVLQQLPVFETIDGRWVKAESKHVRIYAAPSKHWETILREYTPTIPCLSSLGDATHVLTAANLTNVSEEEFLGACLAPWLMQHGQEAHEMVCVAFLEAVERCSRVDSIWKRKQERYPRAIITVLSEVPLVRCVDGKKRLIQECMDPYDPDLRAVYGSSDSSELYPESTYCTDAVLKVLRHAGMASLGDGAAFVRAAKHIARQPPDEDGRPTEQTLVGARQLLAFLTARSASSLQWSNAEYQSVAAEHWAPAIDMSGRTFPPTECLRLMRRSDDDVAGAAMEDRVDEEPVTRLSTAEIRKRIVKVYRHKNPAKQGDVSKLMKKYRGGKEMALYRSILKKYAVDETYFDDEREFTLEEDHCPDADNAVQVDENSDQWRLVSLSEAGLHRSAGLIWTQLMVLDPVADGLGAALASRLRCPHPPPSDCLAKHLKTATLRMHALDCSCGSATAWRCRAVIQQCCLALTKACKKAARITTLSLVSTLGECSFVLTDTQQIAGDTASQWVKARQLCLDLEDSDLGPDARLVPSYLEDSRALLQLLGSPSALDTPKGAPPVRISANPPTRGFEKFVRAQFNQPGLSDVQLELSDGSVLYVHALVPVPFVVTGC